MRSIFRLCDQAIKIRKAVISISAPHPLKKKKKKGGGGGGGGGERNVRDNIISIVRKLLVSDCVNKTVKMAAQGH